MRRKFLLLNTITSISLQAITILCAFILPRLILKQFGSEVNGLTNSISQFLSIISFLELGVGAVIQSALYKPLSDNNSEKISEIIVSGSKFFRNIAFILTGYVVLLVFVYPLFIKKDFGWLYTASLIGAMCIGSFAQYYFGIIDSLLLNSDQKGYIQFSAQIIFLILNTVCCCVLIRLNASIQLVKFVSSLIFLAKPVLIRIYVNKNYDINRKIRPKEEPIEQKWNGIAQHVAAVILDGTDTIVLTIFSTLSNVSVYSVYHMVVSGIKTLFMSSVGGVQALLGEMIAKDEKEKIYDFFSMVEFSVHTAVTYIFTCTGILIVPFVKIYTKGITDVDYIQPLFALLIVCANAGHCLRLPYNIVILASGHYKQTQSNYIIAATLNIVISILTVHFLGLIGVAIGTLVAMLYQTMWMAVYDSKNIINWPIKNFIKQCIVDLINIGLIFFATRWITLSSIDYLSWIFMALKVVIIAGIIVLAISIIFYHDIIKKLFSAVFKKKLGVS